MQLIKDKKIIENTWTFIADDEDLVDGNITVSLSRWNQEKAQLVNHKGKLGLRLNSTDNIDSIVDDLEQFSLIELDFKVFTDGRSFSQTQLLRDRYNFQGEIRAVGNFLADQVFYLSQVGVNSFQLENETELPLALSTLNDFSVSYQRELG